MSNSSLNQYSNSPFNPIRKVNGDGLEYWSGRDLMPILGYQAWHRFEDAIDRAKSSCENAGNVVAEHFTTEALKIISAGRPSEDCYLTRYGAYLVAMNGDPRKPEIAAAQTYFALKTREAENQQLNMFDSDLSIRNLELQLEIARENVRSKEIDLETLRIEKGIITKSLPRVRPYIAGQSITIENLMHDDVSAALEKIVDKARRYAKPISTRDLYRNIAMLRNLARSYGAKVAELTLILCKKLTEDGSFSLTQEQNVTYLKAN